MWCRRQVAQSFVPIELLSCTRLRHLSFTGCQGLFLPPVVGELISLQSLRVNRTEFFKVLSACARAHSRS